MFECGHIVPLSSKYTWSGFFGQFFVGLKWDVLSG